MNLVMIVFVLKILHMSVGPCFLVAVRRFFWFMPSTARSQMGVLFLLLFTSLVLGSSGSLRSLLLVTDFAKPAQKVFKLQHSCEFSLRLSSSFTQMLSYFKVKASFLSLHFNTICECPQPGHPPLVWFCWSYLLTRFYFLLFTSTFSG